MNGLWLSQTELDRLLALVGQLRYVEALPIIQLLSNSVGKTAPQREPVLSKKAGDTGNGSAHDGHIYDGGLS